MISRLKPIQTSVETRFLKPIQKQVETRLGVPLLDIVGSLQKKSTRLVGPKKVLLPQSGTFMNYYEKRPISMRDPAFDSYKTQKRPVEAHYPPPTLLLLPGIGSKAAEYCSLLRSLDIPNYVRVLIPENVSQRVDCWEGVPRNASPHEILESTSEFLDVVLRDGSPCNAVGLGLGGGLLYFLRAKRPDAIQKTCLIAPTIPSVLSTSLVDSLSDGSNPFLEFDSRDDVEDLCQNYLWTNPNQRTSPSKAAKKNALETLQEFVLDNFVYVSKDDPMPTFFYEGIYQTSLRDTPRGHYKYLQDQILGAMTENGLHDVNDDNHETETKKSVFAATTDLDTDCHRLLLWPEQDQISDIEKGKEFFGPASTNTQFETIPNCGHLFDANRKLVHDVVAPEVKKFIMDFEEH